MAAYMDVSERKMDKQKETVDLMSIVRTLSSSADLKQRDAEKVRLEKAFSESDRKLESLITDRMPELNSIIQSFSTISGRVTASQERIRALKENLQSCKNLLHCKRDELRRLWIEGCENKAIYQMLDDIERVKDVGDKLRSHVEKRQYLKCTTLVVTSLTVLEGDLAEVEALREVKMELLTRKEELYDTLTEELHKLIYVKSTSSVVKNFLRQGSQRQSQNKSTSAYLHRLSTTPSKTANSMGGGAGGEGGGVGREDDALKMLMDANLAEIIAPHQIRDDLIIDPDVDPLSYISMLVESLAMLKRLPNAIELLQDRIKPGLLAIVERASQQVADLAYLEGEDIGQLQQPQFLLELLQLCFKQFRIVARVHAVVLANIQRIKTSLSSLGNFVLYDSIDVWNKIQSVIQMLLGDYLDIRNTSGSQSPQSIALDDSNLDFAAYFGKKRPTKPKKTALFRFDASSHAISMSSYLREQRQEFYDSGDMLGTRDGTTGGRNGGKIPFVCRRCASNITAIYNPLQQFMSEIETAMNVPPGKLALESFVQEFVKNIYLNQVQFGIENDIYVMTKGAGEMQRTLVDLHMQRELNVPKPLLLSTVTVARSIEKLCELMRDLPDYADQFINMICKVLQDYLETACQASYKDYVATTSDPDQKRIISATWVKDDDINRFLRSLPNWQNLKQESTLSSMSEEDLRSMNSKESSILTSNLSGRESLISSSEIITDVAQLRSLGNLCESLEWFAARILDLAVSLKSPTTQSFSLSPQEGSGNGLVPDALSWQQSPSASPPRRNRLPVSDSTITTLQSLAQHFRDQSELCLIVLHLEVRVHCFYHLLQVSRHDNSYCGVIDKMEPDENVTRLNKDLCLIEETMQQTVQPKKFRYIFEGLGHLVSTVLINTAQFLKRINENGIKKMCRNIFAIQQCLTNITSNRESDLDYARQYYELLYLSTDELLCRLMHTGPQYSEIDYIRLIELSARSPAIVRPGAWDVFSGISWERRRHDNAQPLPAWHLGQDPVSAAARATETIRRLFAKI